MKREEILQTTELFLLDLDGTVYLDSTPIGDMAGTLSRLRSMGKRLVYLTNNSSKTEAEYRAKLEKIGLIAPEDGVYTSGMATEQYLQERYAGKKIYLVGTEALKRDFLAGGLILDEDDPDVCVLAYDTELTFEKIRKLDYFLKQGKPFLATHPDDVCPTAYGSMPDVGSFLAMLERSSGRRPDVVVGKPQRTMGEYCAKKFGVSLAHMCMVGDRMHTDIRFANHCGVKSILVLSGETTRESMKNFPDRPDLVLPTFNDIFSENCLK